MFLKLACLIKAGVCGVMFLGAVRRVRQSVDIGRCDVQAAALRADRDASQYHVYSNINELRPLPCYLPPTRLVYRLQVKTQGDDYRVLADGFSLRVAAASHLHTGTVSTSCFAGNQSNQSINQSIKI